MGFPVDLMAAGVEGREPIANWNTFKIAVEYSKDYLMSNGLGKIPLRDVLIKYKDEEFSYGKKVGFPVDLTKIFKNKASISSYDLWFEQNIKVLL